MGKLEPRRAWPWPGLPRERSWPVLRRLVVGRSAPPRGQADSGPWAPVAKQRPPEARTPERWRGRQRPWAPGEPSWQLPLLPVAERHALSRRSALAEPRTVAPCPVALRHVRLLRQAAKGPRVAGSSRVALRHARPSGQAAKGRRAAASNPVVPRLARPSRQAAKGRRAAASNPVVPRLAPRRRTGVQLRAAPRHGPLWGRAEEEPPPVGPGPVVSLHVKRRARAVRVPRAVAPCPAVPRLVSPLKVPEALRRSAGRRPVAPHERRLGPAETGRRTVAPPPLGWAPAPPKHPPENSPPGRPPAAQSDARRDVRA